jgi:Tfp pilus assembly protein PilP
MNVTRHLPIVVALILPLAACSSTPSPSGAAKPKKAPAAAAKSARGSAAPSAGAGDPAAAASYTYAAEGRRDPFVNVLGTGAVDPRTLNTRRGEGLAGVAVNELAVRGLVLINGARVALVQGPDGRNYNVHQGDKLMDGVVKSIVPEGLVIMQDVNDPLSTAKQREVRRLLRSQEEAKP